MQCNFGHPKGHSDTYWSTYAIRTWLEEWFRQHPMEAWIIDNYDGRDSYEELNLKISEKHHTEPPLNPKMFQRMRATLEVIEMEMDEIIEENNGMMEKEREMEWHKMKIVALSVCNDYPPKQSQWGLPDHQMIAEGYEEPKTLESPSSSAEEINHVSQDQADPVVRKDHALTYPREAKANQRTRQHNGHRRMVKPHEVKSDGESMEKDNHKPEDQEDLVDQKGCEMLDPIGTTTTNRVWRDQGQSYHIMGWSCQKPQEGLKVGKQLDCVSKGMAKRKSTSRYQEDEEDTEDEQEHMVCNMTGQGWESLPFPIIIDSGGMRVGHAHELVPAHPYTQDTCTRSGRILPRSQWFEDPE